MHFGENQLSRNLIGLSPLAAAHPLDFSSGFGPPRGIARASAWPRLDRPASGLRHAAIRLFKTRFRSASPFRVRLATQQQLAGSFFNRHAITG